MRGGRLVRRAAPAAPPQAPLGGRRLGRVGHRALVRRASPLRSDVSDARAAFALPAARSAPGGRAGATHRRAGVPRARAEPPHGRQPPPRAALELVARRQPRPRQPAGPWARQPAPAPAAAGDQHPDPPLEAGAGQRQRLPAPGGRRAGAARVPGSAPGRAAAHAPGQPLGLGKLGHRPARGLGPDAGRAARAAAALPQDARCRPRKRLPPQVRERRRGALPAAPASAGRATPGRARAGAPGPPHARPQRRRKARARHRRIAAAEHPPRRLAQAPLQEPFPPFGVRRADRHRRRRQPAGLARARRPAAPARGSPPRALLVQRRPPHRLEARDRGGLQPRKAPRPAPRPQPNHLRRRRPPALAGTARHLATNPAPPLGRKGLAHARGRGPMGWAREPPGRAFRAAARQPRRGARGRRAAPFRPRERPGLVPRPKGLGRKRPARRLGRTGPRGPAPLPRPFRLRLGRRHGPCRKARLGEHPGRRLRPRAPRRSGRRAGRAAAHPRQPGPHGRPRLVGQGRHARRLARRPGPEGFGPRRPDRPKGHGGAARKGRGPARQHGRRRKGNPPHPPPPGPQPRRPRPAGRVALAARKGPGAARSHPPLDALAARPARRRLPACRPGPRLARPARAGAPHGPAPACRQRRLAQQPGPAPGTGRQPTPGQGAATSRHPAPAARPRHPRHQPPEPRVRPLAGPLPRPPLRLPGRRAGTLRRFHRPEAAAPAGPGRVLCLRNAGRPTHRHQPHARRRLRPHPRAQPGHPLRATYPGPAAALPGRTARRRHRHLRAFPLRLPRKPEPGRDQQALGYFAYG